MPHADRRPAPPLIAAWLRRAVAGLMAASALAAPLGASAAPATGTLPAPLPPATFDVARDGGSVVVRARALVRADRATVWRTLVDYARLPDFIPDMRSSAVVSRDGADALVRQTGRAGIGPFTRAFSLTLAVHEVPLREVSARAVEGDFERFESSYVLRGDRDEPGAESGVTRLEYEATITPRDGIPPLVGVPIMRAAMQRQFEALLMEMDRRGRAAAIQVAAD